MDDHATADDAAPERAVSRAPADHIDALLYAHGQGTPVRLRTHRYSRQDRSGRAIRALALFWALAIISIFIPVAHFILVPGFLVAGVVVAWIRWRRAEEFEPFEATCPECGDRHTFTPEGQRQLPLRLHCPVAQTEVLLKESPGR